MQLFGGFLCELACIIFLSTINVTIDVIIKFLALSSISKIDDFYAAALPAENKVVKNKVKANGSMINDRHRRNIDDHPRTKGIKILGFITKIIRIFYCSYIYYFFPFLALCLPYLSMCGREDLLPDNFIKTCINGSIDYSSSTLTSN